MLTEERIKSLLPKILSENDGYASKEIVVKWFERNYNLDAGDKSTSSSRKNEPKFVQRIGNIICHRPKDVDPVIFPEGFGLTCSQRFGCWMFFDPKLEGIYTLLHENRQTRLF